MRVANLPYLKSRLRGKPIENYELAKDGSKQIAGFIRGDAYVFNWTEVEPETEEETAWLNANMPPEIREGIRNREEQEKREREKFPEEEKETLMHLSTGHIRPETFDWLIRVAEVDGTMCPFYVCKKSFAAKKDRLSEVTTTGVFIHLVDADEYNLADYPDMPEDLKVVLRRVVTEGVHWLILDHDAPYADEYCWPAGQDLPVFDWPDSYFEY